MRKITIPSLLVIDTFASSNSFAGATYQCTSSYSGNSFTSTSSSYYDAREALIKCRNSAEAAGLSGSVCSISCKTL